MAEALRIVADTTGDSQNSFSIATTTTDDVIKNYEDALIANDDDNDVNGAQIGDS